MSSLVFLFLPPTLYTDSNTDTHRSIFLSDRLRTSVLHAGHYGKGECRDLHVLPGTSVGAGWSLSGWQPEAEGYWATGRAARHLSKPEPGHTPCTAHTHKVKTQEPGRTGVWTYQTQLTNLCAFPRDPVVLRKNSAVNQPHRTLPPQLHPSLVSNRLIVWG